MTTNSASRPSYHFTPPQNWINDPNGMVYLDGEWHLFFQHNPFGIDWGHMSWGHAVSHDLAHWEHLPVALPEQPGYMIFSGSAAVDWHNAGGFGERALVAAYTAHTETEQTQHIAFSTDRGRTWTTYAGNPVIALGLKDFRDPKIFWHAPTQRWVMVTALPAQRQVRFYASLNLREWTHLSDFGPAGAQDGIWECPDFFPMRVENPTPNPSPPAGRGVEHEKWMLKVDNGPGIDGHSGGQYFIGDFDGATFICDDPPSRVRPLDFGADFYAAQSWSDAPSTDGRRVWLGWMSNWAYAAKTPTSPWRGMMTLPRELSLRTFDDGVHLAHQPARELQALRRAHHHIADVSVDEANAWLAAQGVRGAALEIEVEFKLGPPLPTSPHRGEGWGLRVRVGAAEEAVIGYYPQERQLVVDRSRAGDNSFSPRFDDRHAATAPLRDDALKLHVFVDACSVEVFADGGRVVISELIFPKDDSDGLAVFGEGIHVRSLDVWKLA